MYFSPFSQPLRSTFAIGVADDDVVAVVEVGGDARRRPGCSGTAPGPPAGMPYASGLRVVDRHAQRRARAEELLRAQPVDDVADRQAEPGDGEVGRAAERDERAALLDEVLDRRRRRRCRCRCGTRAASCRARPRTAAAANPPPPRRAAGSPVIVPVESSGEDEHVVVRVQVPLLDLGVVDALELEARTARRASASSPRPCCRRGSAGTSRCACRFSSCAGLRLGLQRREVHAGRLRDLGERRPSGAEAGTRKSPARRPSPVGIDAASGHVLVEQQVHRLERVVQPAVDRRSPPVPSRPCRRARSAAVTFVKSAFTASSSGSTLMPMYSARTSCPMSYGRIGVPSCWRVHSLSGIVRLAEQVADQSHLRLRERDVERARPDRSMPSARREAPSPTASPRCPGRAAR